MLRCQGTKRPSRWVTSAIWGDTQGRQDPGLWAEVWIGGLFTRKHFRGSRGLPGRAASPMAVFVSSLNLICELRTAHILFIRAPGSQLGAWHRAAPANVLNFLLFSQMGIYLYGDCLLNCQSWRRDKASWGRPHVWVTGMRTISPFSIAHFPGSFRVLILLITQITIRMSNYHIYCGLSIRRQAHPN